MKTQDIKDLVDEVLSTISRPYPTDITDQVCLAIEEDPAWHNRYKELVARHGEHSVNSNIGWYTRDLTGLKNLQKTQNAKSDLIKTYSELG